MRAVLVQNIQEKYALKYVAYMWHYGNMWRKWRVRVCLRWTKCAEMLKNAIAYAEICDYMQIFANLCINKYSKCINKYSKFWKCHCMLESMRCAHFCKIYKICCDRMIAINRYPYMESEGARAYVGVWGLDDAAKCKTIIRYCCFRLIALFF